MNIAASSSSLGLTSVPTASLNKDTNMIQVNDQSKVIVSSSGPDAVNPKPSVSPGSSRIVQSLLSAVPLMMNATHNLPLLPNFVSNLLTITPVDANDAAPKPPAKVQNQVTIINLDADAMSSAQQRTPPKSNGASPSKRATDHSISTIMASPPSDTSRPISIDSSPMTSPVHSSSSIDILNKAAAVLHKWSGGLQEKSSDPIRISNVQSLATPSSVQKKQRSDTLESCSSDDVEFVGTGSPSDRYRDREKNANVKQGLDSTASRNDNRSDTPKSQTGIKPQSSKDQSDHVDVGEILQQIKVLQVIYAFNN